MDGCIAGEVYTCAACRDEYKKWYTVDTEGLCWKCAHEACVLYLRRLEREREAVEAAAACVGVARDERGMCLWNWDVACSKWQPEAQGENLCRHEGKVDAFTGEIECLCQEEG